MISTTASILYLVAMTSTAVSIVAAVCALRVARQIEERVLRFEEAARATPSFVGEGGSAAERRLFLE